MGYYLKIWADHSVISAEYKGGSKLIRPKRIIVTSNYTPEQIWPDKEGIVDPIRRRFTIIVFKTFHGISDRNTRLQEEEMDQRRWNREIEEAENRANAIR